MKEVIVIFDIGKTNKKVLLFDKDLKVIHQQEQKFEEIKDDDGFECDNIELIESWIINTLRELVNDSNYKIKAVNFTTYGATLMYIDENGKALTPLYNYLKPLSEDITGPFYKKYGGKEEFSRKTASPPLGFLNSGLQILWLKTTKPEIFAEVDNILHFPQYCSYILTGKPVSEYTSIGCHTAMWDFDQMKYHHWLAEEGIELPEPVSNSASYESRSPEFIFPVGIGIHDSSASLAPYIMESKDKFVLLSTGTWCINMNPFNYDPLMKEELNSDCLSYMSISQKPVKSSRLFMGHIHDVNLEKLVAYFDADKDAFKKVKTNEGKIASIIKEESKFFNKGMPDNYIDEEIDLSQFEDFNDAYHQLVCDLTALLKESIDLILPENDDVKKIYISGGFSKNEIFIKYLASLYNQKTVYTSEIDNSTALGAAMVMYENLGNPADLKIDLGFEEWKPIN